MPDRMSGPRFRAGCATVFVLAGLITSWESLNYYWNWDDLHLIRAYSRQELLGTLTGHWDPDEIESSGFRPMTTLFNHARATAFGERVVVHRLFLLGLFSAFLTLLGGVAVRLGEHRAAVLLAGILAVTAKNSYYHFVWIADGVHLLQAFFFAMSAHFLLRDLNAGGRWSGVPAVVFAGLALATREDSLAIVPVLLLIGHFYVNAAADGRPTWSVYPVPPRLRNFAVALFVITAVFWVWRSTAVPGAARFNPDAPVFTRVGQMMLWTVSSSGLDTSQWVFITVGALAVTSLLILEARDRRRISVWLVAALITTSIGSVEARPNLLMFPISFYSLFLASTVVAVARKRRWMQVPAALLLASLVILSVRSSRLEQLSLHPLSTDQIYRDWYFIYGPLSGATVPSGRRDVLRTKLERLGVTGADFDFDRWEDGHRGIGVDRPGGEKVFVPPRRFLDP
jgi:hypothetical protein